MPSLSEISNSLNEAMDSFENAYDAVHNASELDEMRKKAGVPMSGKHYNSGVQAIYDRIAADGFDDGAWNPAGGQMARLKALKGKNWKAGYLMAENGDVKYPFISASGKAMVSGIRACIARANTAGETKVQETASAVLEKINNRKK